MAVKHGISKQACSNTCENPTLDFGDLLLMDRPCIDLSMLHSTKIPMFGIHADCVHQLHEPLYKWGFNTVPRGEWKRLRGFTRVSHEVVFGAVLLRIFNTGWKQVSTLRVTAAQWWKQRDLEAQELCEEAPDPALKVHLRRKG